MSYFVYILYSKLARKHYIGSSENVDKRLEAHNSGLSKYTCMANDWKIIYQIILPTKTEALILEKR